MAFLAVNRNGEELVFNDLPTYDRVEDTWQINCTREVLVYDDPHDFSAGHHCEEVDDSDYGIHYLKAQLRKLQVISCHSRTIRRNMLITKQQETNMREDIMYYTYLSQFIISKVTFTFLHR